jgi:hypothetical protein
VTSGRDGDPDAAEPAAAGPPDRGRAETYLRLRAEAELRRVQALPRPDPPGLPAPLRAAARLVQPPGRRAASILLPVAGQAAQALQPLAGSAARALQPLADTAGRTLPPLAGNAARALQPLADTAAQRVQPLAGQVIGMVLPAADQAARRLHPLAWDAVYRLQALRNYGGDRLMRWPGRVHRAAATLRGTRAGATPARWTPENLSAEEGVERLRRVADALVQADAIDRSAADSVLDGLETALAARSRIDGYRLVLRSLRARHRPQSAPAPAGRYLAAPVGVTTAAAPDSGLACLSLFTLVIAPDRAALTVAGRVSEPPGRRGYQHPSPPFPGPDLPDVIDDRGNRYVLHEESGWGNSEGEWGGVVNVSPVPPAGTQWLELTVSPGSPAVRMDLTGPGAGRETAAAPSPDGLPAAGSPIGRLIDAAAEELLRLAVTSGDEGLAGHDLSGVTDIVTALDAVGALAPARDAVSRLLALASRLGVTVPPALSAAVPPGELPAAWADVVQNRHRRDGRPATAAGAAVLPELDGARFVVAGLRSQAAGAELDVLGWGLRVGPHPLEDSGVRLWSWSARDNQGRWHVADEDRFSGSDFYADMSLRLVPPLHPEATALELFLSGRSGQVTATVPLDWMEPG